MVFFSTQIFDDISGNGSTITLLISLSNVLGAVISIFLTGLSRIKTFSTALLFHAIGIFGVAAGIWLDSGILAAIMVCIFTVGFAVGNGSMLFIYCGEILPSAAMGLGFAS